MEVINHELVIRNVETDIQLGTVIRHWKDDPSDPSRQILLGWTTNVELSIHILRTILRQTRASHSPMLPSYTAY
jgi:hypothetical protein